MHRRDPYLALAFPRTGRAGTVDLMQGLGVQNVRELALSVACPRAAVFER